MFLRNFVPNKPHGVTFQKTAMFGDGRVEKECKNKEVTRKERKIEEVEQKWDKKGE
jgi:hypothetical protein